LHWSLAAATKQQYEPLVALGLGGLDKSGGAEITFKDRRG
jgi:3-hydroxyisobutyrate dehydrogenase